jgi:hypothetical protein
MKSVYKSSSPHIFYVGSSTIVANKKVALSALVKRGMKTVDKNIDKKNKQ